MSDIVQTLRQLDQQIEKLLQERDGLRIEVDRRRAEVGRLGERVAELGVSVNKHRAEACRLGDRVAELEAPAAVPPECVVKLLEATKYRSDATGMLGAAVAKHYGLELPPTPEPAQDGYEWQPVDADHPLTEKDDGRLVRLRCNTEAWVRWLGAGHDFPFGAGTETYTPAGENYFDEARPVDIIAVLRPQTAPEPPKPLPGEVWESELLSGGAAMVGEIVSTRSGLAYLLDAEGDGLRRVAFAINGDRLRCRYWDNRKLTRRVGG